MFALSSSLPKLQSPLSVAARISVHACCVRLSQSMCARAWSKACTYSCVSVFGTFEIQFEIQFEIHSRCGCGSSDGATQKGGWGDCGETVGRPWGDRGEIVGRSWGDRGEI